MVRAARPQRELAAEVRCSEYNVHELPYTDITLHDSSICCPLDPNPVLFSLRTYLTYTYRRRALHDSPPMSAIAFQDTRADVHRAPLVLNAAWHFTSVGAPWQLQRKLRTWGHANMFDEKNHPGSLDLARLERCQRQCLEASAVRRGDSRAPSCSSRAGGGADNRRLPGQLLTEVTLSRARLPDYLLQHRAEYKELLFRYVSA